MEDDSWYLGSYDEALQAAYHPLTLPPLSLEVLHPLSRNVSPVDKKIYTILHTILSQYELWFTEVVLRVIASLHDVPASGRGALHQPKWRCWRSLESELERVKGEAEAAMRFSLSSMEMKEVDEMEVEADEADYLLQQPATSLQPPPPEHRMPSTPSRVSPSKRVTDHTEGDSAKRRRSSPSSSDDFDNLFSTPPPFSSPPSAIPFLSTSKAWGLESRAGLGNRTAFSRTDTTSSDTSTTTTASTVSIATTISATSTRTLTTPSTSMADSIPQLRLDETSQTWVPAPSRPAHERQVFVVAPNSYQHIFDREAIHFAVQWEFERLLSRHKTIGWSDVLRRDIKHLKGAIADVLPRLEKLVKHIADRKRLDRGDDDEEPHSVSGTTTSASGAKARMYMEMELEEQSIRSEDLKGLGSMDIDWAYGGKITYTITITPAKRTSDDCIRLSPQSYPETHKPQHSRLVPVNGPKSPVGRNYRSEDKLPFKVTLLPPDMAGKSFRLARRFGSRRILTFKFKDIDSPTAKREAVDLLVGRTMIIFGRTYRAIWAPSGKDSVFCVETCEEDYDPVKRFFEPPMPSFEHLFAMYNDLDQKPNQAMAKWAARPQILFSDSVPGPLVDVTRIGYAKDIVSREAASYKDATTEQTLTDGCGLMSETLAQSLRMGDEPRPCVVQMRLGGSKGLLAVMSPEQQAQYPYKDVILRDSMIKALPSTTFADDPSLLTVDVLRYTSLRIGGSLSFESIIAMAHNGVPADTFLRMSAHGLEELEKSFDPHPKENETEKDVSNRLITACFRQGGVGTDRKKRKCLDEGMSTRVAGLSRNFNEAEKLDGTRTPEEEEINFIDQADRYGVDPVSGQSNSIAESLFDALCAGFHPLQSHYAGSKLHHLVSTLSDSMIRRFKIPVDQSLTAFIVPDSQQLLKPDEIYISFSSSAPIDPRTNYPMTHLSGPVLAFRSPCKLPTDVRKFTAVYKPELAYLKDCVVLSANSHLCARSPASYLGGGDYDGDTVQLFWDPELVAPFLNAPDLFADVPPDFIEQNFDKEVIKVKEFLGAVRAVGHDEEAADQQGLKIGNMQRFLLGGLEDDKSYSNYSDWHGNAVYTLGFDHPETVRLARMFCHVLDARKSGLQVRASVKEADAKKYGGALVWREFNKKKENSMTNPVYKRRPTRLGEFILDRLMDAGMAKRDDVLAHFPSELANPSKADYDALGVNWKAAKDRWKTIKHSQPAAALGIEIERMRKHVTICRTLIWKMFFPKSMSVSEAYDRKAHGEEIKTIPRRNESPTKSRKAKMVEMENDLVSITILRHLAEVWRDKLTVEDVPTLCGFGGEGMLRRMKVGCAAEICTSRGNRTLKRSLPFDMDFYTCCALKSEAMGPTRSVQDTVLLKMKPTYC